MSDPKHLTPSALVTVGTRCLVERRFSHGASARDRFERTVVKLTKRRAYFESGTWFALDDPKRVVKPPYLDYVTVVVGTIDADSAGGER